MYTMTFNDAIWATPSNEKTVFNNFAPAKMNEKASGSMHVEYTDLFGRRQIIPCKNRTQLKKASEFLSIFKREENTVKTIIGQYNVKNGKFQNVSQLKKDLIQLGFGTEGVKRLVCLK